MTGDGSFGVEEFLEAITSQLDRTQDALRLKAVNRPLTYAIRDFSLDLRVAVEMNGEGQVRFRSSSPNDTAASTVSIGFTTITRPMIEENTITLSEAQSPSLADMGFAPEDQRSLEKIGVRNASQLKRLSSSSGETAVSRFADVPVNRLRAALQASRPQVDRVSPAGPSPAVGAGGNGSDQPAAAAPRTSEPDVAVPPGTRRLRLDGTNLRDLRTTGSASLGGVGVPIVASEDDHVIVDLGRLEPHGRLAIDVDGAEALAFQLNRSPDTAAHPGGVGPPLPTGEAPADPWTPS